MAKEIRQPFNCRRTIGVNALIALMIGFAALASLRAATITGTVRDVSGTTATVEISGAVAVGDGAEFFFKLTGTDDEISVGSGKVTATEGTLAKVKIEDASGEVAKDQLVRIISDNPPKKSAAATPALPLTHPPLEPSPTATPVEPTPEPSIKEPTSREITLNSLSLGALGTDALASAGIRIEPRKGAPEIFAAQPNMLLPAGRRKVMLVGGGPVTSISIVFDQPLKRFTISRVGTQKGASTPTWTMTAFNGSKSVDSTGETHGLPPKPKSFAVQGKSITRVQIDTDNRFGTGTWATWNSLPIAGFAFDR